MPLVVKLRLNRLNWATLHTSRNAVIQQVELGFASWIFAQIKLSSRFSFVTFMSKHRQSQWRVSLSQSSSRVKLLTTQLSAHAVHAPRHLHCKYAYADVRIPRVPEYLTWRFTILDDLCTLLWKRSPWYNHTCWLGVKHVRTLKKNKLFWRQFPPRFVKTVQLNRAPF